MTVRGLSSWAPNQVLFALGWARIDLHPTCTNLLNPTSGRDASHPCLINLWPKEGCTVVCVIFHLSSQSGIVHFGMGKDWPTSHPHEFAQSHIGRDASHPCLISLWLKEGCTIVCVIMWARIRSAHWLVCTTHSFTYDLMGNSKGEGGGFPLNPKMHLFVGGLLSRLPIRYCSLWDGQGSTNVPPARICSILHRGETPPTLAL